MNDLTVLSCAALMAGPVGPASVSGRGDASSAGASDAAWRARMLDQTEWLTARGSAEVDMATGDAWISQGLARLAGRTGSPGRTDLCTLIGWLPADEQDFVQAVIESATDDEPFSCFHRLVRPDGGSCFVHQHGIVRVDPQGRRLACLSFVDVTERHRIDMDLLHRASTDPVTGLPNRHQLAETIEAGIDAMAWDDRGSALLLLRVEAIDDLQQALAQADADEMARAVATRLRALLPLAEGTVVDLAQEWFLARTGAAEFAMLLRAPQAELSALAAAQAQRVLDDPSLSAIAGASGPGPRLAVGLAFHAQADVASRGLLQSAEAACRDAQAASATRAVYDAGTRERALHRLAQQAGERRARAQRSADPVSAAVRAGDAWPLLDQLPVATLGLDAQGTVVLANAQADRLLGENLPLLGEPMEAVLGVGPAAAADGTRLDLGGRHFVLSGHATSQTAAVQRLLVLTELPGA